MHISIRAKVILVSGYGFLSWPSGKGYNRFDLYFTVKSGLFLPAVVRPILDSMESSKQVPPPALSDVVAGMTGKKQE